MDDGVGIPWLLAFALKALGAVPEAVPEGVPEGAPEIAPEMDPEMLPELILEAVPVTDWDWGSEKNDGC